LEDLSLKNTAIRKFTTKNLNKKLEKPPKRKFGKKYVEEFTKKKFPNS